MDNLGHLTRRRFLYGSALAAGSVVLSACTGTSAKAGSGTKPSGSGGGSSGSASAKGSAKKPLPKPASFNESPQLKGKGLPPVEQRLPDSPYVVPHNWTQQGKYGGKLNMPVFGTTGMTNANSCREFFYGISPTRWLNDGLDIGPGIADSWTSNKDASVWTIHFRTGLKWSDGHPFSVDDVLFWWEDIVLPGYDAQVPPPDCLSAKGNLVKMSKVDNSTLKLTYDSPQPLVAEYLAAWVKGNTGKNGPSWVMPKHYLKNFNIKYNKKLPKDWDSVGGLWETKADWLNNPDCPTLTGWKCKSSNNNTGAVLERNPYYYAVTKEGDQLPYIDEISFNLVQNAQVIKLQVQQGKTDFCFGNFNQLTVGDVSTLSQNKQKGNYEILLWDNGSGTGYIFFLNYDYQDKKYGPLFRDKRFRQAISLAHNRATTQKTLYFGTGEQTTGTMSPKAIEFHIGSGPSVYKAWRDSYKNRDVAKAKSLLAELGLKDTNGDGYVEFPDGSKLDVQVPYSADIASDQAAHDDQLVADVKDIGLRMTRVPIAPQAFGPAWNNGTLMSHTNWDDGDGPDCLVYPQWMIPIENTRWAPLEGAYYSTIGTPKEHTEQNVPPLKRHPPRMAPDPNGPIAKLLNLYNQTKLEPDAFKRHQLVWEIVKVQIKEGPFFMGSVANTPQIVVKNTGLMNVPAKENLAQGGFVNPWTTPSPAVYDTESFYWSDPTAHNA